MPAQATSTHMASLREEKKISRRKSSFTTLQRIILTFLPYKGKIVLVFLSILVSTALNLAVPLLIPLIFDDALAKRNVAHLLLYGSIMISAATLSGVLGVGQTYLNNQVGQHVMRDLRNRLYSHLQNLSLSFFTSMRSGEVQSRLSNDISSAQSTVTDTLTNLISSIVSVLGTIIAMLYLSPYLTLVSFVFLPLFLFLAFRIGNGRRKSTKATQQSLAALNVLMQETLSVSGILLIKIFGRKAYSIQQFETENQKLTELSIRQQMSGRWFFMFMNIFTTLMPVVLCISAGIFILYMADNAHITVGKLFAFITIQGRFFGPFNQLLMLLVEVQGSLALFDRIFEYLDHRVEIQDAPGARDVPVTEVRGQVSFKNVSFAYTSRGKHTSENTLANNGPSPVQTTLKNISFTAQPSQLVALVGPSGAGKTTLSYLLPRLYEADSGTIEIDGHEVRNITLASLQAMIGMVTQETHLFHASIRHNLLYVRPEATEEEIINATKVAAIHDRIMELDEGYETMVGERGYKLSGGEKQRLAIARVLLKNPRILILDEATSSLDTTSEHMIQEALKPLMKGRTTIAIAHRLSTIRTADLILVLEKGEIVERGNHEELLASGGVYARLYYQQFAGQMHREVPLSLRKITLARFV